MSKKKIIILVASIITGVIVVYVGLVVGLEMLTRSKHPSHSSAQQTALNKYQELLLSVSYVCEKDIVDSLNVTGSIGWAWTNGTYTCLIKDGTVVVCEKSSDSQFTYYKEDGITEETTVESAVFISYTCKTKGKTKNNGKFTVIPSIPTTGSEDNCKVFA